MSDVNTKDEFLRLRLAGWLRQKYVRANDGSDISAETHDLAKTLARRIELELTSIFGMTPQPVDATERDLFAWLSTTFNQISDDRQRVLGLQYMLAPVIDLVEEVASRIESKLAASRTESLSARDGEVSSQVQIVAAPEQNSVLWFMANGWDVSKALPVSFLTDVANEATAWVCKRTMAPFCTNARSSSRQWDGPTPHAALQASVSDLGTEFPQIAALQSRLQPEFDMGPLALAAMEARKDAALFERARVVAALAKCFPSGLRRTEIENWSPDWHECVYIDLPTGQVSWHIHDSQVELFADLPPYQGQWDGHTTEEKYARLAALAHTSSLDASAGAAQSEVTAAQRRNTPRPWRPA